MNDESKAALIEHLRGSEYNGKSAEESHLYFHTPRIVETVSTRLKPLTTAAFFAILSRQSAGAVIRWNNLGLFIQNIREQNREGIGMLIQGLAMASEITQEEMQSGLALLQATEQVTTTAIEDAPIVRVLNPIADSGRPNVIPVDEFNECFTIARG